MGHRHSVAAFMLVGSLPIPMHAQTLSNAISASSLGFAVENDSTFREGSLSGSFADLALSLPITSRFRYGIKTIASGGGHGSEESFYRLSSGIFCQAYFSNSHHIEAYLGHFSQTYQLNHIKETKSQGLQWLLGWTKYINLTPKTQLGWGAFRSFQNGKFSQVGDHRLRHSGYSSGLKISISTKI